MELHPLDLRIFLPLTAIIVVSVFIILDAIARRSERKSREKIAQNK